jgi:nitroimidazol reductase NimA-like FMN-containing flavoprotein (pyridoxamine 5'-phosphate oxidase superfamily)
MERYFDYSPYIMSEITFRPMRRHKQQLASEECLELLSTAPRGVLAVIGDGGYPYAIPLDFVYDEGTIYFHSAKEGHKIDAIRACDKATFCVMSQGEKEAGSWWYHFKSVVCFGRIHEVEDAALADAKLRLLGKKYFPEGYDLEGDMKSNAPNALVLAMKIEHVSGKRVKEK